MLIATPKTKYEQEVLLLLPTDSVLIINQNKIGLKHLHIKNVKEFTENHHSQLWGKDTPEVNFEEKKSHEARCTLAQLYSRYSTILNSYLHRIRPNTCTVCNLGPHDMHHLFNCPGRQTNIGILGLWTDRFHLAEHLQLT